MQHDVCCIEQMFHRLDILFRLIISRIQAFIMCEIRERRFSLEQRIAAQCAHFENLGLSRDSGKEVIDTIMKKCGFGEYEEDDGMFSEHLILLGAISARGLAIKNVLEIGTFDGRTSIVLSELFPHATITTIDIPPSDPAYFRNYEAARTSEFIQKRNSILRRSNRVKFIEMNSVSLTVTSFNDAFDIIWVDGDHEFPVVGMDIANCVRLLRGGGFLLCDDVVHSNVSRYTPYLFDAAHRSLVALRGAGLIDEPTYVYKRLGKRHQPVSYTHLTLPTKA